MKNRPNAPMEIVPSGRFAVGKKGNVSFEAYLGTCLGVTMCDREAGVGGLSHLLLPEPTGLDKLWRADAYATTGLPLFIQALCEAGADKKRLEACIAGGALVGPVSRQDLDLDIGGRTAEIVENILKGEEIPIISTETGGYFSCKLCLDLKGFDTSIQPITSSTLETGDRFKKPTDTEVLQVLHRVRPIPQVALKVARMINRGDYKINEVADEIKQDQVISAKMIRLCNSSFIGLERKIASIDRAFVILGEKLLLQLVISASLELYFSDSEQGYSLCKGGLFQHALGTALVAEKLAGFTGSVPPEIAYTAGLMHDIGKVVLDQYIFSISPFFYRSIQIDMTELCKVEQESFGLTHTEAGGLLGEEWDLPENLIDSIRHHHYPEKASVDSELSHLVYLADLLMSRFRVDQELECLNTDQFLDRLNRIGLTPAQLPLVIDLIPGKIFDLSINPFQSLHQA